MNIRASLWPAYREYLRRSDLPILVGPWRGEVGFEALYWIPFIHRFVKSYGIDSKRIIPISRGGASAWYGSQHGVELYRMRTIQQVRVENKVQHVKHAQLKQTHWIEFDRAVVKDAAKALGLKKYLTLHPAWMYARLYPFFLGQRGMQDIDQDVYFDQLPAPALPDGLELPERFVAVRFYLRYTYNNHPMLIQFAQESIKAIARPYASGALEQRDPRRRSHGHRHEAAAQRGAALGSDDADAGCESRGAERGDCQVAGVRWDVWRAVSARTQARETVCELLPGLGHDGNGAQAFSGCVGVAAADPVLGAEGRGIAVDPERRAADSAWIVAEAKESSCTS
jgi:hypothetical protein